MSSSSQEKLIKRIRHKLIKCIKSEVSPQFQENCRYYQSPRQTGVYDTSDLYYDTDHLIKTMFVFRLPFEQDIPVEDFGMWRDIFIDVNKKLHVYSSVTKTGIIFMVAKKFQKN